jgi:hypothetical protein
MPRGAWASFKITRGNWASVEKDAACAERANRRIFGAPSRAAEVTVRAWADTCN